MTKSPSKSMVTPSLITSSVSLGLPATIFKLPEPEKEGTPALVHTGPFANIAHGNSSIVADYVGLDGCEFVVTEAGFGADMGAEKFFNIKCRISGLRPDAAVVVATVRALKMHSGRFQITPGKPLPRGLAEADQDAVAAGFSNLAKQIENVRLHGVPVVVAINRFPTDTDAEIAYIKEHAVAAGATAAHVGTLFDDGGKGGEDIAQAVIDAAAEPQSFQFLYPEDASLEAKIEAIAQKVYGAGDVSYSDLARQKRRAPASR